MKQDVSRMEMGLHYTQVYLSYHHIGVPAFGHNLSCVFDLLVSTNRGSSQFANPTPVQVLDTTDFQRFLLRVVDGLVYTLFSSAVVPLCGLFNFCVNRIGNSIRDLSIRATGFMRLVGPRSMMVAPCTIGHFSLPF